ncbi:MAG: MBL fold metallo-hydrolase [Clostridia bacterium]|nr:MBL fold metallo-hydrolase [Clostridia bacterium]
MKVTFIGATHEVTGSCTLLENGGKYYLVDCGMEQGVDVFENIPIPVPPASIAAVFVTHAHIDHTGMLPKLFRDGFQGRIYATSATCHLCNIMLMDSAHIQESEAEWKNRKAIRSGETTVEPLYTTADVQGLMPLFVPCEYSETISVDEGIRIRFTDIGHLLGSSCIEIWMQESEVSKKIVFSGDVGNVDQPIIRDPQTVDSADYLVIESTYGDRLHEQTEGIDVIADFAACMQRVLDRGGNLVIPAFAVGRTQELLYGIREIKARGLVHGHDDAPIILDSPLAQEATAIFRDCDPSYLDEEALAILSRGENPVWFEGLELSVTTQDSVAINNDPRPKVIISASGMCDAGRIRHHLKHNLWNEKNMILFVGYQAAGTLGSALINGAKEVKLFGETIAVHAEIGSLHGTSGHADQKGLINWVKGFSACPRTIFVNHGDADACETFAQLLRDTFSPKEVIAPYSGTEYDLSAEQLVYAPEGKRIVKPAHVKLNPVFESLKAVAQRLLDLINRMEGRSNHELKETAREIVAIIEKHEQ